MILGLNELQHSLQRIHDGLPAEMSRAVYEEALIDMAEATQRTPKETGALRSTGTVHPPEIRNKTVSCTLSFGGPDAPYAVYVHEIMDAIHPVGQAKYLESVILESRPFMAARLAKRIDLNRIK